MAAARAQGKTPQSSPPSQSQAAAIGPGPEQDDVAARQLEETPNIRRVFGAPRAFPRHAHNGAEREDKEIGKPRDLQRNRAGFCCGFSQLDPVHTPTPATGGADGSRSLFALTAGQRGA